MAVGKVCIGIDVSCDTNDALDFVERTEMRINGSQNVRGAKGRGACGILDVDLRWDFSFAHEHVTVKRHLARGVENISRNGQWINQCAFGRALVQRVTK